MAKRARPEASEDEWLAEVEEEGVVGVVAEGSEDGKKELNEEVVTAEAIVSVSKKEETGPLEQLVVEDRATDKDLDGHPFWSLLALMGYTCWWYSGGLLSNWDCRDSNSGWAPGR